MTTSRTAAPWTTRANRRVVDVVVPAWLEAADGPVAVRAQYPDRADRPLPVVAFCHGLGASHLGYTALGARLVERGHAVLHPQFRDAFAVVSQTLDLGDVDETTWPRHDDARAALHTLLFDPEHWLSRVARVHAVLDSLATQSHLPVELETHRVIIAGHSYGAYTAQLVAGARLHDVGLDRAFSHPSVTGAMLLSPQGSGDRGLTPRSWDDVRVPLLVVTATGDLGAKGEGLPWRREPFDAARSEVKHLAVVRGGDHQLGGIPLSDPDAGPAGSDVADAVTAVCAAFADLVHGNAEAGRWLAAAPFPSILDHEHRGTLA